MSDYDALVTSTVQNDAAQSARVGFASSLDTNPDAYAEAQRIARRTGVPVDTAFNLPQEMKKQARMGEIDFDAMAKTNPATAKILADVDSAKLAHDNVESLSAIEQTLKPLVRGVRSAVAGTTFDLSSGMYGLLETGTKAIAPLADPLAGTILPENPLRRVASGLESWRKGQQQMADKVAGEQGSGFIETAVNSGFRSFGQMAPGLLGTVMTGNPTFALASAGLNQGSQSATKALDKGLSPYQAISYGAQDATAEILTEMIPVGRLLKDLNTGAPFLKVLGHQIATEVPTEMVATAWQNFNEWANLNPEKPFSSYVEGLPEAEAQTVIATVTTSLLTAGLGKGVGAVVNRMQQKQQQSDKAEQSAALLENLGNLAAADKLLQRNPETFEQFVNQAAETGPVQDVFISAQTLMQSGIAEQLAQVSPSVAQQLPEAMVSGGDIRIPVGEYAAKIAPTEYAQSLIDHLKTDPEGFSRAEAQEYMQSDKAQELQAEVERVMSEIDKDQSGRQQSDEIKANIKAQLDAAARFTPQVNDAYASMVGNWYGVMSARMGISPQELYQRYPLKVAAESVAGGQEFAQGELQDGSIALRTLADEGNSKAIVAQSFVDGAAARNPKQLGNVLVGISGLSQSDSLGGVPSLAPMLAQMRRAILNDSKVLDAVVGSVPVDMVNNLFGSEAAAKVALHDEAMNENSSAFNADLVISEGVDATDPVSLLVREAAVEAAKVARVAFSSGLKSQEGGTAIGANNWNSFSQGGSPRATFNPSTLTVTLLSGADLTSFLHESGHFFLESLADIASQQDAPQQITDDMQAVLKWFGLRDLSEWSNLDFEEKRSYHEQFARGFEAYLFEGKSPSIELQSIFQRFRAWMLNVYQSLKNLNVQLNDEVREVFDRMLASNEEIHSAEQARSMMPLFESAQQAGMTEEAFRAYQSLGADATNEAIEELQAKGLRDMQWAHNARGRMIQKLQKQAKERRAEVMMQARKDVMSKPIYQAWEYLTGKDKDDPESVVEVDGIRMMGHGKLGLDELRSIGVSEEFVEHLKKLRMTAKEGLSPDLIADRFGFSSGDDLVRSILAADAPKDAINKLTDLRMLEQYGELATPYAIERSADQAIHNEVRARFIATEANALAEAMGERKILNSAAKLFAEQMISRLMIRNIKPTQYASAEARAAKASAKAFKEGDTSQAAAEKRNQLISAYAAKAAYQAQDDVESTLRYFKKFDREGTRKNMTPDYLSQIDALLDRFDLRKLSNKDVERKNSLRKWLDAQKEAGIEPDIPEKLQDEAYRKSYKDLTVEEFRGLADSIKQIEHLGRLKKKLLTAKDQREYAAARDEMVAKIEENARGRKAVVRTDNTYLGRAAKQFRNFWASHIKVASYFTIMEGGNHGPLWNYIVRPANERADWETTMRAEATKKLWEIMAPVWKVGRMGGSGIKFDSVGRSFNREARIAIALNMGNEGNMQRLLGGEGWTMEQVAPILRSLTAAEWNAVQGVWDHLESYRPLIAEKEMRVYGKEPNWVEPRPLTVQTADGEVLNLRGGYYPIKYDPAASLRAESQNDAEDAERMLKGAYTSATTKRSFTKSRVEEVSGRPLLYSLAGMYSGVNDVIHDLAWHEWLIDTNRFMRSQSLDTSIRDHYGPEVKQQIKKWIEDIAVGERGAANAGEEAISRLRQGISASGLGFNLMSAIIQPLGITQSLESVGYKWVGQGVAKYLSNPVRATKEANELSEFMRNRSRTRFRELNELRNKVQSIGVVGHFDETVGQYAYFLMMRCQQMVDVPTWWGAYNKAISEGNDEGKSISLADQAVIDSQGGGNIKDQAGIERSSPVFKIFTVFYSFMNTALNVGYVKTKTADTPAKRGKLAATYLMLYTVPAVLGYMLKNAITPGDSGDDDWEKIAKKLLASQIDYLFGLMVVVREFAEAGKTLMGANDMGRDYTGPAGLRLITDSASLAKQVHQGEFDDAFRKQAVNVVGDLFGLPAAQVNRTWNGVQALAEGETDNPFAIGFGFQKPH